MWWFQNTLCVCMFVFLFKDFGDSSVSVLHVLGAVRTTGKGE